MTMTRAPSSLALRALAGTVLAASAALAGCGGEAPDAGALDAADTAIGSDPAVADPEALTAAVATAEIPYPLYPNGRKYRVGGENGLKIVVFQTEDSFDEVDAYYQGVSSDRGTPRLLAMSDYVRYPSDSGDADPWATYRPGIVIHEFEGEGARLAAGANASARTNIIMSY